MLDLFSGLGGARWAMRERGWRVVTIEIDAKYRPDVVGDVARLPVRGQFDLVWASPPCTEYSRESMPWSRTGASPSYDLWKAAEAAIESLSPRWWVIENVRGAVRYHGQPARRYGPVFLWGRFPPLEASVKPWKERLSSKQAARRAEIPRVLSLALARSCETAAELLQ
jgi:site-specific DNA-cytosine methylase